MKKIKYGNVDTDNPLNWTQEDFDEVIYDFINVRVLSGQPIPPAINKWYCAVSQDIQKKRMGIVETTETDADRYRKALEEIEKVTKALNTNRLCFYDDINDCSNCDMNTDCNYLRKYKILNIIKTIDE